MMNQEIKARWVAWLRANVDKQARGRLHHIGTGPTPREGFCCLGGLCELAIEDGIITKKEVPDSMMGGTMAVYGTFEDDGGSCDSQSHTSLPTAVVAWAGVQNRDPRVNVQDTGLQPLSVVNDDLRLNFEAIANLIEAQL